ncbi:hypothetical protein SLS62_005568 [Diatrype stigma]|uniref:G-protein coupled receptors family 2 profile 2 domain-containing protein n=1 Tax=Diatrype stigma TaxID=117547 RepID=A0AAN9UPD1_9PEZI
MNLGFIIPLAGKPEECFNEITPHGMDTSSVCAASGAFLLGGGWAGIMWIFLRALSLHLQICWQIVVGRTYMWFAQILGWGIPIIGLIILLTLSGVSFRFGATCHINHENSLADFWIPLLVFAGLTMIIQFTTFGYCIKVYLASLTDNSATTENSGMPSYTASIRTMTPRQAYRRVRRVIQLQWRGIVIVLIIVADVIFFSIVFVFQDNTVQAVKEDMTLALPWIKCLMQTHGSKDLCIDYAGTLVVSEPTVIAVLILLAVSGQCFILPQLHVLGDTTANYPQMNGLWLLVLLGRWSMITGWVDYFMTIGGHPPNKEFVSVDARANLKKESRSYEMLSHSKGESVSLTAVSPVKSYASPIDGRRTPDYFGQAPDYFGQAPESFGPAARYQPHQRSFSAPRPPQQVARDTASPYSGSPYIGSPYGGSPYGGSSPPPPAPPPVAARAGYEDMNPLGMNRI